MPDKQIKEKALTNHLDMQYELHLQGVPILREDHELLIKKGYITPQPVESLNRIQSLRAKQKHYKSLQLVDSTDMEIDRYIEVIDHRDGHEKLLNASAEKPITEDDWKPNSIVHHTREFVNWIDSIRDDISDISRYKPFEKYVAQADMWLSEYTVIHDGLEGDERFDLMMQEIERCDINSLYALNKYYYYQDEYSPGGRSKFYATDWYLHQRIIAYLFDCGYSMLIGKPRQFGGTTLMGMLSVNRILSRANYYIKFITEDKAKGEEIFEDKIKFAFYSLDDWFIPHTGGKPDVLNDREGYLRLGRKGAKGRVHGLNSRIRTSAPYRTSINGGSPSLVLIDEVGSIDIFSEMLNEGRPTMFRRDPVSGRMEQKRQVIGWGTGTSSKGGAAFEKEYKKARAAWVSGDYSYGVIPLFFNWTTRCDEEEYLRQKRYYYGARAKEENIDQETSRVQFHQHYPTDEEDMFTTTEKVLYPRDKIRNNLRRIGALPDNQRPIFGYLEPVYDRSQPLTNPVIPFKIIGVEFIETEEDDFRAHTTIFRKPQRLWKYRYFAGTDPIAADDGLSNMSTTIWDKYLKEPSALVSFREPNDPNANFLQSLLLSLYYNPDELTGCPELIEKNIGLAYKQFKQNIYHDMNLIHETELPDNLVSNNTDGVGIDNKGNRAKVIINKMSEVVSVYEANINIRNYWNQLKMFVSKVTRSGNQTWGSADPRYYKDDDLYSLTFSYIAAETDPREPRFMGATSETIKVRYKTTYDENYNLIRVPVTKHIENDEQPQQERTVYSSR